MNFKSITSATCICLSAASFNLSAAAVISTDWQTIGDNLITTDTVTGLEWLDLTETNNISYNTVVGQLGAGGQFEGFRYATTDEVVALWANWNIDLSALSNTLYGSQSAVVDAVSYLGNTWCELNCTAYPQGATGYTDQGAPSGGIFKLGAYNDYWNNKTIIFLDDGSFTTALDHEDITGSYLVKVSTVPVPAAVWLFGSGLIGLISVARRKKT